MKSKQEFDRSKVFMMHYCIHEQILNILREFGAETAINAYIAIADYGYYGTEIPDGLLKTLVGSVTLEKIEQSQEYRAQWFNGENFEQTKLVAEYMRDHPNTSQRTIAAATGVSKTKVGKVQKSLKESEFSDIQEYLEHIVYPQIGHSNTNVNSNGNSNNVSNSNSVTVTETSPRDHFVDHLSGSQNNASLTTTAAPTTSVTEDKKSGTELNSEQNQSPYTFDDKITVMKLFKQHIKPADIAKVTGFTKHFIHEAIDEFRNNNDTFPKPPIDKNNTLFCTDGKPFMNKTEFFNDCTNNGTILYKDISWQSINECLIQNKVTEPDKVISEMKQKLLHIQSMSDIVLDTQYTA